MPCEAAASARTGRATRRETSQLTASAAATEARTSSASDRRFAWPKAASRCRSTPGGTMPRASRTWRRKKIGPTETATRKSVPAPAAITSSWAASSLAPRLRRRRLTWLLLGRHRVADAAHGANHARRARIVSELLSQLGNMDVDNVLVAEPARSPNPLEQLAAAEDEPRVFGERLEQLELEPRQLDRLAV